MIHPYPLQSDTETGVYYFTTANQVKYVCRFRNVNQILSPVLGIYDLDIYDFDFYPEIDSDQKIKFDEAVCLTICELFTEFFTTDLRVLVYICDSIDGKHQGRDNLFRKWHKKHVANLLYRIPVEISLNNYIIYGCALVTHNFPHMDVLQTELLDKIEAFMTEKNGE